MQCKHMIKGFNLNLIEKFCHKRDKITQSINVGSYVSSRFKKNQK